MKYAILGDIHANLEALTAVLAHADGQGVDARYSLGDVVGYGADPVACLEQVRETSDAVVKGNHDDMAANNEELHGEKVFTHMLETLDLESHARYLINAGSVGQPRDLDPRAAYVVYDTKTRRIEMHRVPYDIHTAADKIRAAGLPDPLASRLTAGR